MQRLIFAIPMFALLSVPLAAREQVDRICAPDAFPSVTCPRPDLAPVDARGEAVPPESADGPIGPMEVIVASVADDGRIVMSCVDTEAALRAMLALPKPLPRTAAATDK